MEPRLSSSTCATISCSRRRTFAVGELWYATFKSSHRRFMRPLISHSECRFLLAARSCRACLRASRAVSSSRRTRARFWTASSLSCRALSTSRWTEGTVSRASRASFSELSPFWIDSKKWPIQALQRLHAFGLWTMTWSSLLKIQGPGSGPFRGLSLFHLSRRASILKSKDEVVIRAMWDRFLRFLGSVGSFISGRCVCFVLAMNKDNSKRSWVDCQYTLVGAQAAQPTPDEVGHVVQAAQNIICRY